MQPEQIHQIKQYFVAQLANAFHDFMTKIKNIPVDEKCAMRGMDFLDDGFLRLKEAIHLNELKLDSTLVEPPADQVPEGAQPIDQKKEGKPIDAA